MENLFKQIGVILIGIGLLIGTSFSLKGVKEKNISKLATKKYSEVVGDLDSVKQIKIDDKYILDKYEGFDHNNELIAYLYEISGSNSYGEITIILGVNPTNGKVIGMKALNVGQTLSVDLITDAINSYRNNIDGKLDGLAGVTYAKDTINKMLESVNKDFNKGGK